MHTNTHTPWWWWWSSKQHGKLLWRVLGAVAARRGSACRTYRIGLAAILVASIFLLGLSLLPVINHTHDNHMERVLRMMCDSCNSIRFPSSNFWLFISFAILFWDHLLCLCVCAVVVFLLLVFSLLFTKEGYRMCNNPLFIDAGSGNMWIFVVFFFFFSSKNSLTKRRFSFI